MTYEDYVQQEQARGERFERYLSGRYRVRLLGVLTAKIGEMLRARRLEKGDSIAFESSYVVNPSPRDREL